MNGCIADYGRAGISLRDAAGRVSGQTESAVFALVHREAVRAITDTMLDVMSRAAAQIGRRVADVFRGEGILAVSQGIVERLATEEEWKAGVVPSEVLNRSPAALPRQYQQERRGHVRGGG